MLVVEPPRSRFDFHFRLAGFPVRVHPAFWLIGALLGFMGGGDTDAVEILIWVVVMFISILVHELGHALLIRKNGWNSRIVLYHLGGLATMESPPSYLPEHEEDLSTGQKILIYLAGPGAGFALAAVVIGVLFACPIGFAVRSHDTLGLWFTHHYDKPYTVGEFQKQDVNDLYVKKRLTFDQCFDEDSPIAQQLSEGRLVTRDSDVYRQAFAQYKNQRRLGTLINNLLFINIFWGLLNLLPVFPLDGGQITRELLCAKNQRGGLENALLLSTIAGAIIAVAALLHFGLHGGLFIALMFALLAFINFRTMQQVRAMGGGYGSPDDPEGYDPDDWWKR